MLLFLREDQVALANHIYAAERANEAEEHAESWSEAVHIEVEERWLSRWRDPEGRAGAHGHSGGQGIWRGIFRSAAISQARRGRRRDGSQIVCRRTKKICSPKAQRIVGAAAAAGNR